MVNFGLLTTAFMWLMFTHQIDFLEDHISAPRDRCTLEFIHASENGQDVLAHMSPGMGVPPAIF